MALKGFATSAGLTRAQVTEHLLPPGCRAFHRRPCKDNQVREHANRVVDARLLCQPTGGLTVGRESGERWTLRPGRGTSHSAFAARRPRIGLNDRASVFLRRAELPARTGSGIAGPPQLVKEAVIPMREFSQPQNLVVAKFE